MIKKIFIALTPLILTACSSIGHDSKEETKKIKLECLSYDKKENFINLELKSLVDKEKSAYFKTYQPEKCLSGKCLPFTMKEHWNFVEYALEHDDSGFFPHKRSDNGLYKLERNYDMASQFLKIAKENKNSSISKLCQETNNCVSCDSTFCLIATKIDHPVSKVVIEKKIQKVNSYARTITFDVYYDGKKYTQHEQYIYAGKSYPSTLGYGFCYNEEHYKTIISPLLK